uniref:Uncharacterized protein n=1 Tax=Chromera velia CCMP2878 TaxID=1169474 RepID=A0A0G4HVV9_9ALVE|eukprot:Cvel_8932.t1-p1 / transcript=Cvel_8932.t1 / gene=Cvel_8932 / organism=Chromera_velia_CCMP2878 / gene_product=hypothetical protein / transcript_product=hypothetical protein / location=Cvel_scaffold503:11326-13246(-) / protein_length=324 / sequence_SO=supercontig / SO=protein_coding / is_pseudo=false
MNATAMNATERETTEQLLRGGGTAFFKDYEEERKRKQENTFGNRLVHFGNGGLIFADYALCVLVLILVGLSYSRHPAVKESRRLDMWLFAAFLVGFCMAMIAAKSCEGLTFLWVGMTGFDVGALFNLNTPHHWSSQTWTIVMGLRGAVWVWAFVLSMVNLATANASQNAISFFVGLLSIMAGFMWSLFSRKRGTLELPGRGPTDPDRRRWNDGWGGKTKTKKNKKGREGPPGNSGGYPMQDDFPEAHYRQMAPPGAYEPEGYGRGGGGPAASGWGFNEPKPAPRYSQYYPAAAHPGAESGGGWGGWGGGDGPGPAKGKKKKGRN